MRLDVLLTPEEKDILRKARERYLTSAPSITFYNINTDSEYDVMYRFNDKGDLLLNVKDIVTAFRISLDSKERYMPAEILLRRVCYNLAEYIGYLNFIYSSVQLPRTDYRYDINNMQRLWNDSTKKHTAN